ncbi:MAG: ABC transporter substrate-binding protein [Coriobacteriia bacterium]
MRPWKPVSVVLVAVLGVVLVACSGSPSVPSGAGQAPVSATKAPVGGGSSAAPTSAGGNDVKSLQKVVVGLPTAQSNPLFENVVIGQGLGYFKQEGIDIEFQYMGSNAAPMAALLDGKAQVAAIAQDFQASYVAGGNPLKTKNFYEYFYPNKWSFAVRPDSPIQRLADLKGKTIGLVGLNSQDESIAKQWLKLEGVNPSEVNFQVVGNDVPAGVAMTQQRVDAVLVWDSSLGVFDVAGIKYRVLPRPANLPPVGGFALSGTEDFLKSHRDVAVGVGRAVAKATVFALANPTAAAAVYVQMYPESVGQGKSREQAIKDIVTIVAHRSVNWTSPTPGTPWGQNDPAEWKNSVELQGLGDKIKNPGDFVTNDLIKDINQFDQETIKKQAADYKVK